MKRELPLWARALLPVLGVLSVAAAWRWGLPLSGVPAYVVPPPDRVMAVFETQGAMLWENFKPTAVEALAGFVAGNLAAVLTAIIFVHSRVMNAAYFPIALFFNTIPILALSPVIILIFGLGMTPKIIIAAIICYFPTLINMIRGLDAPTANERELFRILSASRWEVFWRLRAPRSLPMLFASLRIASATAVIGAIVGEWIGADKGLGALIIQATFNYQADRLYAAIILSSILSLSLFAAVVATERRMLRWTA